MKAALRAIQIASEKKTIHIISDSLNTVRYVKDCTNLPNRKIRKEKNALIKLRLKKAIEETQEEGGIIDIKHIRSHANDKWRKATTNENKKISVTLAPGGKRLKEVMTEQTT